MKLERYRRQIDLIDAEIVALLTARHDLSREIGAIKAAAGLPVADPRREADVLRNVDLQSGRSVAVREVYRGILEQSRRTQAKIAANLETKTAK